MVAGNTSKIPDKKEVFIILAGIPLVTIIVAIAYSGYYGDFFSAETGANIITSFSSTVLIWLGCRAIAQYLWRKYPWHLYPGKHILIEIPLVVGYTVLASFLLYMINLWLFPSYIKEEVSIMSMDIVFTLVITFFILSLHEGWYFFSEWKTSLVNEEKLKKENMESQLETLKNQINPHFLFNTLNTLATLIDEDKKTAITYVEQTADFFRAILALKDKEIISLKEEMALIENFYELQKKRYGNNLQLIINIPAEFLETYVAPLTFQMLTENAIKHNIISKENPLQIAIFVNGDYLVVQNNIQKRIEGNPSSGIGLANITKRYSFLTKRNIEINQDNGFYTVKIPILKTT